MAQTGYTPIQLYYSSTTTNAPSAGNLAAGELAINTADGKLFYKDSSNAVQVIAWKETPVSAGGTGSTTLTANYVVVGNGTSAVQLVSPSTSGYVLTSNGTGSAPTFQASTGASKGQAIAFSLIFGL